MNAKWKPDLEKLKPCASLDLHAFRTLAQRPANRTSPWRTERDKLLRHHIQRPPLSTFFGQRGSQGMVNLHLGRHRHPTALVLISVIFKWLNTWQINPLNSVIRRRYRYTHLRHAARPSLSSLAETHRRPSHQRPRCPSSLPASKPGSENEPRLSRASAHTLRPTKRNSPRTSFVSIPLPRSS